MSDEQKFMEKLPIEEFHGGIDSDLVGQEFSLLIEELICPICEYLVWDAKMCKVCEKSYCKVCINKWLLKSTGKCPNRCKYETIELSRTIKNLLNKVQIKCLNNEKGCNEMIGYEQYENHYKNCNYNLWKCKGCGLQDIKQKILAHIDDCDKNKEQCPYCKQFFKLQQYLNHFNN